MEWEVTDSPTFSLLKVKLSQGEQIFAESGAMVYVKGNVDVETVAYGGFKKALLRSLFGGESLFFNSYTALDDNVELGLAPVAPGDIKYLELTGSRGYIVQDMAYLAHHGSVDIDVTWKGLRGLLAQGELFYLRFTGVGGVWVSSCGAMKVIELGPGEEIVVDNFQLVAFEETVSWEIKLFGKSLKTKLLGGEGVVVRLRGPGKIIIQTRSIPSFVEFLRRFLPVNRG